ncbi:hypothetical protein COT44_02700 [Candidatus Shapirobacteria bacterium CG08_land_8_20_14_0_20_39_18]|uniref:Type II toxin-antitoxin system RelE/ParE family toxin n=1 Tax=Candidatus Shapirobacteria bacterium CG08_land_8_20_14_0_20_39_18 TaxID=1974883 RepID=A0A2M6XCW0_9BACT|nr:MAG: hypothetical protein COT44_02700 [Candidatus Shapirobacteria bacterium CG08_land_8_20_14_0_20_39_18]PJE68166.1 MAG: hypothetical protein COU94_03310 [Candidatus Shapirobacteria bacterium CG10_big_fil_rev_8_21_14_0_10_38_8]
MHFEILYYEAFNGKQYVREFLNELEKINYNLYKVTIGLIDNLENSEYHCFPTSKPLGSGLFELKPSFGTNTCRINWCKGGKQKVYLLNEFIKKNKKRQQKEIEKARKLMKELKTKELI